MKEIKYIDNNMELGIDIDFDFIEKEFKKLKIPDNVYKCDFPWNESKIFIAMSKRGTGKTTNMLLKIMICYQHYGSRGEWIRQTYDMIKMTNISEMFNTIRQYDYVSKITKRKYNDVIYKNRSMYFCKYDGDKKPSEIDTEPFLRFNSIDEEKNIRSSYNSPTSTFIVFDEYQAPAPRLTNEFVDFFNIVSTIRRKRENVRLVFLGNTTSPYCHIYHEMDISKVILKMNPNDKVLYTNKKGCKIYIEWVEPNTKNKKHTEKEKILDNQYFGFDGLNSIVGGGWDIANYPHIEKHIDKEKEVIERYYLHTQIFDISMQLCWHDDIGYFCFCRPILERHKREDIYTFTDEEVDTPKKIKGVGKGFAKCRKLWKLIDDDRFLYSTNDIGELVYNYYLKWK